MQVNEWINYWNVLRRLKEFAVLYIILLKSSNKKYSPSFSWIREASKTILYEERKRLTSMVRRGFMHNITVINCEPNKQFSPLQALDYPEEHSSYLICGGILKSRSSADIWKINWVKWGKFMCWSFCVNDWQCNGGQHDWWPCTDVRIMLLKIRKCK